ncbi:MAG: peptide chain release factor N(5)-glutamine methyltransferase [Acidobacteria bacterium]|nr:peptide chain release factor N(5)-glutamine methyltransferase [Acidobacteriota bacterium]
MTIQEAIIAATRDLTEAGVEDPRTTARFLLAHLLQKDRTYLITHFDEPLDEAPLRQFQAWVGKRASGVPLQYITGHQEFYGLDFVVTPNVLIPRPETELMVEDVLERNQKPSPLIIDVGTGSGCLAVTLAVRINQSRVVALEISEPALRVARRNAQRHGAEDRILFLVSDLFSALTPEAPGIQADFIVSNPPYVSDAELDSLPREVAEHEPRTALLAGPDGLAFFRRLLAESPAFLQPGGVLILEMGFGQHTSITALVDLSTWRVEKVVPDLQGIQRTLVLRLVGKN